MRNKIIKTTRVVILYREYKDGKRLMRIMVNKKKTNYDKDFKPIKRWIVRDYINELFTKDY